MFDSYIMAGLDRKIGGDINDMANMWKLYSNFMGIAKQRYTSGYIKKKEGNINLSEMRRAFIWYLTQKTDLTLQEIANIIGCKDHATVIYHKNKAREFDRIKDPKFTVYYNYLTSII